ncbi:sigma-54-dependent Fis family transcriptional regulator [Geomonas limicola]|uniref:DNA-binding transcriptional regulator NtrC n=1 Tax=Geomonas limicola TaxID=2740186 RepID=A0A6V8NCY4_9BACT|nr:sigma-54 dependent transcriptional regulator [Geomonas limicola]GFO70391.1 sigma-54-dependent Fis family transcriptional regulator [Geomonas limicola]
MTDLKKLTVLLVDDEAELRQETAAFLSLYCREVLEAANGAEALAQFSLKEPDLVLSDIRMPIMDGLELATRLKELSPATPVVLCTAFTETGYLMKAIELGIGAFVRKPADTDQLLATLARVALPILQRRQIEGLSGELRASLWEQLGGVPAQRSLAEQVTRVARSSYNVLLQGETGTGKSRLASLIHSLGARREAPFVLVQMGALPVTLVESELFGHLKGAFTGAERTRTGLAERADGGTLFLDDIESAPLELQAKLLRFVEEKRFTPVGAAEEKKVDVRIIAASNLNLKDEAAAGRFRQDLYFRLADTVIAIPSLRSTPEAVLPLALRFLRESCEELGIPVPLVDEGAQALLTTLPWPGNIRQLKSLVRRVALETEGVIRSADVAALIDAPPTPTQPLGAGEAPLPPPFPCTMETLERWTLEQALRFCGGKRMKTSAMLGMNYYTFRRKLEKYGLASAED